MHTPNTPPSSPGGGVFVHSGTHRVRVSPRLRATGVLPSLTAWPALSLSTSSSQPGPMLPCFMLPLRFQQRRQQPTMTISRELWRERLIEKLQLWPGSPRVCPHSSPPWSELSIVSFPPSLLSILQPQTTARGCLGSGFGSSSSALAPRPSVGDPAKGIQHTQCSC